VTLFYGTSSPAVTAFTDEVAQWEAAGVKVVAVTSPTYVQDALKVGKDEGTCGVHGTKVVQGTWRRVYCAWVRIYSLGFRVWGLGYEGKGSKPGAYALWFWVQG